MTIGQKFLHFLHNRVFRAVFLVFCLILAVGVVRSVITIWQKQAIVGERLSVLRAEEAKNTALMNQLREATSSAFIEKTAREKLGLVKPGETVVIMNKSQNVNSNDQATPQVLPSWKQWWGLFF